MGELQKSRVPSEEDGFYAAMELSVKGYILKESAASEIVNVIKTVATGQHYVTPSLTSYLLRHHNRAQSFTSMLPGLSDLTPTERLIVPMIADYKSSEEVEI